MKGKALFFLLFVLVISACQNFHSEGNLNRIQSVKQEEVPNDDGGQKIIITFKDEPPNAIITQLDGEVDNVMETLPILSATVPEESIDALLENPEVESIEEDIIVSIESQHVGWGLSPIKMENAWTSDLTGEGVNIAVIDSGIDLTHEDLRLSGGASFVNYTQNYHDDNGHGTHVAGIIGAQDNDIGIIGVAPGANLYGVKVLDDKGAGNLSTIIAGIDWSIQNGMDIINLSLGMNSESRALASIIKEAYDHNILIVAAAGNSGTDQGIENNVSYPARYPETIAVAATDEFNHRAPFSATGEAVELSAPGVSIVSTYPPNTYATVDGTSMATPYATGLLALCKEANPQMSNAELRVFLQENSLDLGEAGRDPWYGFGLIQSPVIEKLSASFEDVSETFWARNEIAYVSNQGWMLGTTPTTFAPNIPLTRAQAATILVRTLDLEPVEDITPSFTDVSDKHWSYQQIEIIKQHGFITGFSDGTFKPGRFITREQMVVILDRMMEEERGELPQESPFTDVSSDRWSYKAIIHLNEKGTITGHQDQTFRPLGPITRAQMAALLQRLFNE